MFQRFFKTGALLMHHWMVSLCSLLVDLA